MDITEAAYKKAIDEIYFVPDEGRSSYFDVWQVESEGSTTSLVQEGELTTKNLRDHLSNTPEGVVSGTRFICNIPPVSKHRRVPWSQDDYLEILSAFQLPRRTLQVAADQSPISKAVFSSSNSGCSYIFQSDPNCSLPWNISGSWNPQTRMTHVLFTIRIYDKDDHTHIAEVTRTVCDLLKQAGKSSMIHPFFIPLQLYEYSTARLSRSRGSTTSSVQDVEARVGNTPYSHIEVDEKERSLAMALKELNPVSIRNVLEAKECSNLLTSLQDIRNGAIRFNGREPASETMHPQIDDIVNQVDVLLSIVERERIAVQGVQKRCEVQLSYIYNAMVMQDSRLNIEVARDSRLIALATGRDSIAMKTVAVMTMFFLPGTFIATVFAMPMFDWQAPKMSQVTGSRFGIYWAVTIPTTMLVLGAWSLWYLFVLRRQERENAAARGEKNKSEDTLS